MVKQIDFRVSIRFHNDGSTGFVFEPLVPKEFEKQGKQLAVWQHGMITSLRSAIIKWSEKHDKVNNKSIKKYVKLQKRFMKEISKTKLKAEKESNQKELVEVATQ